MDQFAIDAYGLCLIVIIVLIQQLVLNVMMIILIFWKDNVSVALCRKDAEGVIIQLLALTVYMENI